MVSIAESLAWLEGFMERLTPSLNDIVIFFLILFLGFLVGKILGRLTQKILTDLKADAFLRNAIGWKLPLERGLAALVAGIIYLVTVILALNAAGLTTFVLELILAIFVLAIVISFLLAIKDIVPNAAAGLTIRKRVKQGMRLRLDGTDGTVKEVNILDTVIETKGGDTIVIPNALFAKQRTRMGRRR